MRISTPPVGECDQIAAQVRERYNSGMLQVVASLGPSDTDIRLAVLADTAELTEPQALQALGEYVLRRLPEISES